MTTKSDPGRVAPLIGSGLVLLLAIVLLWLEGRTFFVTLLFNNNYEA